MKNKFGFAPILILVIIVIMAIALALLGHITTDGTCDYQAGWNRYPPKSCNCIGIKIMMEKYGAINERLADLNLAMAYVYANFVQFKNKLPFFNRNCVTS